jgi:2-dehydropantoate 2-reductase
LGGAEPPDHTAPREPAEPHAEGLCRGSPGAVDPGPVQVLIHGAGAVGLGLASALLAAGARVGLVARPATVDALLEHGLLRTGVFGRHLAPPGSFEAASRLRELPAGPADFALVTTKSYDAASAAAELAAHPDSLGPRASVVLCQNGWGNAERAARYLPEARLFSARVITGFARRAPHHVEITVHAEPVRVGSLFGADPAPVAPLCAAIARGGIPCETTARIAEDLWAKLLYNGCLNPLGAIFGVPYGALGASEPGRALLADVAREITAVMRAAGFRTHWESAEGFLAALHRDLLPPTANHESSMLQDLRQGRPTEVDALTGEVVRLGEAHGVPVPVNRTLLAMVRFLETARRTSR